MNYHILDADLGDHFHSFKIDYESKKLDHYFNGVNFFSPTFSSKGWNTVELHEFEEFEEYLPIENGKVVRPSLLADIVYVWGAGTYVFSKDLKNALSEILNNSGYFLEAKFNGELWYFYYCNVHLDNVLDLNLSEYEVFDDGKIMVIHNTFLLSNFITNEDVFRASNYTTHLIISDRVKAVIEKYFVGEVFQPVKVV